MSAQFFAKLIDLVIENRQPGSSTLSVELQEKHLNMNKVAHGAVLYALADSGMGVALYPSLDDGMMCATVEIKMNYFKPVFGGKVICKTEIINRGKRLANLDSRLYVDDVLVAQANGNYAIFPRKT